MDGLQGLDVCIGAVAEDKLVSASRTLVLSSAIGVVLGVVGGALLWPAHRIAGALIGGLIVGPAVGGAVGFTIASSQVKQAAQLTAGRK